MASKIPIQLKAAAELEIRRRQKKRAAECYSCEVEALIHEIYETVPVVVECAHKADEQDINSSFNQSRIEKINLIYGRNNAEISI